MYYTLPMAMGKRKRNRQPNMWVATTDFPTAASHPFYTRLNQLLRDHGFDDFAEGQCAPFYADTMGRPGLPPGIYFRLLLIGYFEGIDSERGIAWRATDSFALRDFLGVGLDSAPPDHSTISRTRRLIDLETHRAVFTWVLQCLSTAGLVKGKTIGIDATTLEANAALRSIVRRDGGESYEEFLTTLAKASGIGTPTRADLARIDRKRKKKGSNDDWTHPHDPDAKITKMKDGRTHLAHKAEHAIDLDTGAIVGVTVQSADEGDTTTIQETVPEAAEQLEAVAVVTDRPVVVIEEVVADKGYHSRTTVHDLETLEIRTYISEPDRGRQSWTDQDAERDAVYANRRRIRGDRGKRLLRRRGELLERPCAHLYETGGLRRAHVRGHENVLKRLFVHAGAFNLGLWMRTLFGVGTPRGLQGRAVALRTMIVVLWLVIDDALTAIGAGRRDHARSDRPSLGSFVAASVQ
ncbi:MAG TPA: transposase [Vicinamibacterales bacterium]|nr:transposase [Vicinamibacterales bacterium]